jgi:cell division protein FtsL
VRLIHLIVVAALVIAAVHVYKIKFESTLQAERLAKLGVEIRRERDRIGALRAEWAQLDSPARIQALAQRHLQLKPIDPAQIETLAHLPERPEPVPVAPEPAPAPVPSDLIALDRPGSVAVEPPTGSVPAATGGATR